MQSNRLIAVNLWWNSWKKRKTHSKKKVINKKGKMLKKKKRSVKEEEIDNEFVDEILKKKERKWKWNIQETWEDKSIVIYSKEVVSLIILGNTFYFTYTLCSKFLLFTLHYVPMKVLFDLKEGMVWILTWLINVCGVIFLVFGILSWDYKCPLFFYTILHLIYMWDISFCSTLFYSHMFESITPFRSDFICWVLTTVRFELKHNFG